MIIRTATAKDKDQVLALMDEFSRFSHSADMASSIGEEQFATIINDPNTHIFVADDNGDLVGLATLYLIPNIRHGRRRGHIEDFFVKGSARQTGVGSKIMKAVKQYCINSGIRTIKLSSGNELAPAHRFYEKNGGKTTERFFRFDLNP
jgi:GNAT superfamily N-acetyltransferase